MFFIFRWLGQSLPASASAARAGRWFPHIDGHLALDIRGMGVFTGWFSHNYHMSISWTKWNELSINDHYIWEQIPHDKHICSGGWCLEEIKYAFLAMLIFILSLSSLMFGDMWLHHLKCHEIFLWYLDLELHFDGQPMNPVVESCAQNWVNSRIVENCWCAKPMNKFSISINIRKHS